MVVAGRTSGPGAAAEKPVRTGNHARARISIPSTEQLRREGRDQFDRARDLDLGVVADLRLAIGVPAREQYENVRDLFCTVS